MPQNSSLLATCTIVQLVKLAEQLVQLDCQRSIALLHLFFVPLDPNEVVIFQVVGAVIELAEAHAFQCVLAANHDHVVVDLGECEHFLLAEFFERLCDCSQDQNVLPRLLAQGAENFVCTVLALEDIQDSLIGHSNLLKV